MKLTEKRLFLIIMLIVIIGSCISVDQDEKERKRLAEVRASMREVQSSKVCYTIEQDGCEYIYCHWQPYSNSPKASIAITPKLNQKDPIKCNLGNMRY